MEKVTQENPVNHSCGLGNSTKRELGTSDNMDHSTEWEESPMKTQLTLFVTLGNSTKRELGTFNNMGPK